MSVAAAGVLAGHGSGHGRLLDLAAVDEALTLVLGV
jgi:hypothetical protein